MFALLLPVLLGATGLVIDSGMLLAAHRQAQNAADAAVMAAAMDRLRGNSYSDAFATAKKFVTDSQYNNLPGGYPRYPPNPTSGAYAGDANAIEAIVTSPVTTSFIQVLGATPAAGPGPRRRHYSGRLRRRRGHRPGPGCQPRPVHFGRRHPEGQRSSHHQLGGRTPDRHHVPTTRRSRPGISRWSGRSITPRTQALPFGRPEPAAHRRPARARPVAGPTTPTAGMAGVDRT